MYVIRVMKKLLSIFIIFLIAAIQLNAQERTVQNRPYTDLRPFHFGVLVGGHLQDIEFDNVGPQTITLDDGTQVERFISCDQDRWELGFNVGVLGELRLHEHFALRIAPAMYFGTRHLTFLNHSENMPDGSPASIYYGRYQSYDEPLRQGRGHSTSEAFRLLLRTGYGLRFLPAFLQVAS